MGSLSGQSQEVKWLHFIDAQVVFALEDSDAAYTGIMEHLGEIEKGNKSRAVLNDIPDGYAIQWIWLN